MRKPDSLRRWLTAALPDLRIHPDRLEIWVDAGRIASRQSQTLSFEYRYTLKCGIWSFAGTADQIMVPLLAWLEKEQPQLLRKADSEPFSFEAELLDSDTSDVLISLELTEAVIVTPSQHASGFDITHPPEPDYGHAYDGIAARFADLTIGGAPATGEE
ncbi:phage tail protein [Altererythrobacter xixiisoli]|uniref:Phage tail protein n=1 Tax=Croceibacterium xixiisoli TaxID=1476466 RepID=A0A6I4TWU2_9SPHN|nr:phage tail protein [Croceibacterium xixiisoli]MXP00465.1 phage tail protein [Croceibacterium xixiisoli]